MWNISIMILSGHYWLLRKEKNVAKCQCPSRMQALNLQQSTQISYISHVGMVSNVVRNF